MPDWLSKAKHSLGLKAEQQPQPFRVTCACRNEMTGLRQSTHQTLRCPQCGQTLFILPRDPFPPVKTEEKRRSSRSAIFGTKVSKPTPEAEPNADARGDRARASVAATTAEPPDAAKDVDRPKEITEFVAAPKVLEPIFEPPKKRRRLLARFRRGGRAEPKAPKGMLDKRLLKRRTFFTRFRLVVLGLLAIVGVTGYFIIRSHRIDQAEIDLTRHGDKGLSLLKEHDNAAAVAELELSSEALDVLGWDNAHARLVRQAHREAVAINGLATAPLMEIVDVAGEDRFNAGFKDKWIVMQTKAMRAAPPNDWGDDRRRRKRIPDIVSFDCPVTVHGAQVRLVADNRALERILPDEAPSGEVIVGGRLASFSRAADGEVTISLDGGSLFLWAGAETLQDLGFEVGDNAAGKNVKEILDRQSQLLGVSR